MRNYTNTASNQQKYLSFRQYFFIFVCIQAKKILNQPPFTICSMSKSSNPGEPGTSASPQQVDHSADNHSLN